jgi:hypothetical protein
VQTTITCVTGKVLFCSFNVHRSIRGLPCTNDPVRRSDRMCCGRASLPRILSSVTTTPLLRLGRLPRWPLSSQLSENLEDTGKALRLWGSCLRLFPCPRTKLEFRALWTFTEKGVRLQTNGSDGKGQTNKRYHGSRWAGRAFHLAFSNGVPRHRGVVHALEPVNELRLLPRDGVGSE